LDVSSIVLIFSVARLLVIGASLGTYRDGESWVHPAFAYNITGASTDKPARALVVLVTSDDGTREFKGDLVSIWSQDIAAATGR
jgi:hypothetical protein